MDNVSLATASPHTESVQAKMDGGTYTADGENFPEGMQIIPERRTVKIADAEALLYYSVHFDRAAAYAKYITLCGEISLLQLIQG